MGWRKITMGDSWLGGPTLSNTAQGTFPCGRWAKSSKAKRVPWRSLLHPWFIPTSYTVAHDIASFFDTKSAVCTEPESSQETCHAMWCSATEGSLLHHEKMGLLSHSQHIQCSAEAVAGCLKLSHYLSRTMKLERPNCAASTEAQRLKPNLDGTNPPWIILVNKLGIETCMYINILLYHIVLYCIIYNTYTHIMNYLKSGLLLQRKTFSASFSGCIPSTSNAKRRMDGNIAFLLVREMICH